MTIAAILSQRGGCEWGWDRRPCDRSSRNYGSNSTAAGKSYVVFGKAGLGSTGRLALSSLDGTNGFALNGEAVGDNSGYSVASAGDVNNDGIADIAIGAPGIYGSNSTAGKSYVVFGRAGLGSSGSLTLSSLNGTSGFV